MSKLLVINTCYECCYSFLKDQVFFCGFYDEKLAIEPKFFSNEKYMHVVEIPKWCPLETKND